MWGGGSKERWGGESDPKTLVEILKELKGPSDMQLNQRFKLAQHVETAGREDMHQLGARH